VLLVRFFSFFFDAKICEKSSYHPWSRDGSLERNIRSTQMYTGSTTCGTPGTSTSTLSTLLVVLSYSEYSISVSCMYAGHGASEHQTTWPEQEISANLEFSTTLLRMHVLLCNTLLSQKFFRVRACTRTCTTGISSKCAIR
jgi:hypothetical protein